MHFIVSCLKQTTHLIMYSAAHTLHSIPVMEIHTVFLSPTQCTLTFPLLSIFYSGRSKKKDHCLNEKSYPLEETETCPCDEFLSQPYGNWSVCILPDPSAPGSLKGWMSHREVKECGQGLRYRAVACIDQQGHLVDPTLCTDSGKIQRNIFN